MRYLMAMVLLLSDLIKIDMLVLGAIGGVYTVTESMHLRVLSAAKLVRDGLIVHFVYMGVRAAKPMLMLNGF
jgi:hypothetical protein